MPKKRVSKITTITKTEYTDGSISEKVEVSEFKSTSLSYSPSLKTIDITPQSGNMTPQSENKALS